MFQYISLTRSHRLTYIQGEQQYKMIINYNDRNDNNVRKMTSMFILNRMVLLNQQ